MTTLSFAVAHGPRARTPSTRARTASTSTSLTGDRSPAPHATRRVELSFVVGDATARAAHRERGADDAREPDVPRRPWRASVIVLRNRCAEFRAVSQPRSCVIACLKSSRSSAFLMVIELFAPMSSRRRTRSSTPALRRFDRDVERRLSAERGQQRPGRSRSMIFSRTSTVIGSMYVRSARSSGSVMIVAGLRVHQDDVVAFLAQRLARLRARVVELARLPDDDRAGGR